MASRRSCWSPDAGRERRTAGGGNRRSIASSVWAATAASETAAAAIRRAVASVKGHATLMRAPDSLRAAVEVFEPPSALGLTLTRRLKQSFDPDGVLNFGRMYNGV